MASEVIKLNLIPKGEMPVFHASQFDTGRLITCELYRGEDAYSVPEGYTVELHCRKVDNNIVTMTSTLINDNVVTFTSTEQLTACNGKNLCEVAILDEGYRIGTLNFILEVEVDPLKGGITSTSEIHNLESQVEEITTEVIGENYYNKTEVDDLLDAKADASSVYTKSETDTKIALKANAADVYTKAQTDSLLSSKADSDSVYTKGQTDTLLADKASIAYVDGEISAVDAVLIDMQTDIDRKTDAADVYTKEQTYTQAEVNALIDNLFPTFTVSDTVATFITALTKPLVSVTAAAGATTVTACGVNLLNSLFEIGYRWEGDGSYSSGVGNKNAGCPDKVPCKPSTTYCFVFPKYAQSTFMYLSEFDANRVNIQKSSGKAINSTTHTVTFTTGASTFYMSFSLYANNDLTATEISEVGINYPSTDTTYHAYNGQTVPVSEATTLVTQSGVNNVFADVGEVTVQYKYMSM